MQFNSKVLLFGEYTVVFGAKALAVPYPTFNGQLAIAPNNPAPHVQESQKHIARFYRYIKNLMAKNECLTIFDLPTFKAAIEQGLYFDSSIPQGCGIGSSGALIAAIYYRYAINKVPNKPIPSLKDLHTLKKQLAQLEGHFHGKSSGTDPIICYLNEPLLLQNGEIELANIKPPTHPKACIFLINSQQKRPNYPLVPVFLEKLKESSFHRVCTQELCASNANCIEAILNNDFWKLICNAKLISKIQLTHFTPMIPTNFSEKWAYGLQHQLFYAKVCGSGGGGFMLGVAELTKLTAVQKYWGADNIKVVCYV